MSSTMPLVKCCAISCYNTEKSCPRTKFFCIPQIRECADSWLEAAGRTDLVGQDLAKVSKYRLCADHFEDRFFDNPQTRQQLIKRRGRYNTNYDYPVPSIFLPNLTQYSLSNNMFIEHEDANLPIYTGLDDVNQYFIITEESYNPVPMVLEPVPAPTPAPPQPVSTAPLFVVEVEQIPAPPKEQVAPPEKQVTPPIEPERATLIEQTPAQIPEEEPICRLCCKIFDVDSPVWIFKDSELAEAVEEVLPKTITKNDGFPQSICEECKEKILLCADIINDFRHFQNLFAE